MDMSKEEGDQLEHKSLLSPQVSRILDNLQLEDKSSSSGSDKEGDSSRSESDEEPRFPDNTTPQIDESISRKSRQAPSGSANAAHGSKTPARVGSKGNKSSLGRPSGDKYLKSPRNHMARFQSLRSNLFQANIENNMKKCHQEAEAREKTAIDWKAQHEKRQGYSRPHTPGKEISEKGGFGRRLSMKIRRLTSKDPSTIANIEEKSGNLTRRESTATDEEDQPYGNSWQPRQSYESTIDHSDVDDLVRWVSRRDPPSDGERRMFGVEGPEKDDSGHGSLGHSDIEDLVRHASRKSISVEPATTMHTGYSDESTASDSEQSQEDDQDQESLEGSLSRWVSRRDGTMAGPVLRQQQRSATSQIEVDTDVDDSDVPEIGRWRTHHDDTSGESISDKSEAANDDDVAIPETKNVRARERSPALVDKGHIHDDDVDELVRWVSRRDSKQPSNPDIKDDIEDLRSQEDKKKQQVGMTVDDDSLAPEDLDDLLAHVRGRSRTSLSSAITPAHV